MYLWRRLSRPVEAYIPTHIFEQEPESMVKSGTEPATITQADKLFSLCPFQ